MIFLLRWLTFLLESLTLTDLLFWIYFFWHYYLFYNGFSSIRKFWSCCCLSSHWLHNKQINEYAGLLAFHLLFLLNPWLIVEMWYYFGRCSSELAQLVPLPFSQGRLTCYSDRLHDFSVTIPRCFKDVYVNNFFSRTARLWNSQPIESFPLTNDLSGFKSRISRHFLIVGSS